VTGPFPTAAEAVKARQKMVKAERPEQRILKMPYNQYRIEKGIAYSKRTWFLDASLPLNAP
jgi:hypothetical protein